MNFRAVGFGREARLVLSAALMSVALTACGGGGGDGGVPAAKASPTPTTPIGGTGSGLGTGNAGQPPTASAPPPTAPPAADAPPAASGGGGLDSATVAEDGSVTLSWNPPTMNDDGTPAQLTGYRVYWGPLEDNPTHSVTVENAGLSRYVVEPLTPATWYFFVTALSEYGESPPSNVISMRVL